MPGRFGNNEKGLALSFNQLGFGKGVVGEPVFMMMRRIAETCSTYEVAREQILKTDPGMPFLITISEASSGNAAVFVRVRDQVEERPDLVFTVSETAGVMRSNEAVCSGKPLRRLQQLSYLLR